MKRFLLLTLSTILILCLCVPASAHSGKTDAAGGHYDSSTGEYHYHHGYPAHSHDNGCPYGYDDKTDHSPGNNSANNSSSGSHSNSSGGGWIVIIIIVIIGAVLAFCFWLCHDSGSSSSKNTATPQTSATTIQSKTTPIVKDSKISKLESEILSLNKKITSLEQINAILKKNNESLKSELAVAKQNAKQTVPTADEFKHRITLLEQDNKSLRKANESLKTELATEKKKSVQAPTPPTVVQVPSSAQDRKKIQDLNCKVTVLQSENATLQNKVTELTGKIKALEQINENHNNTISSLKKELIESRKATHSFTEPAEEERRHYEEIIEKLKEELKETTYFKNLFTSLLRKLEREGDSLFYNYPSVHDFLRQVTDKRFHRAMIEDIAISGRIQIQAPISSAGSLYTTSLQNCSCVDYQRTHAPCKHMLYLAYHSGVLLIHQEDTKKSLKTYLDKLQKTPVPKK